MNDTVVIYKRMWFLEMHLEEIFRGNITFGICLKCFSKGKKGHIKQVWQNLIIVESGQRVHDSSILSTFAYL